jgi:hypothetical protein
MVPHHRAQAQARILAQAPTQVLVQLPPHCQAVLARVAALLPRRLQTRRSRDLYR